MVDHDPMQQPWYAHANDLVGGWSVMNVDRPPSEADYRLGEYEIGSMWSEQTAKHVVELHNATLRSWLNEMARVLGITPEKLATRLHQMKESQEDQTK